MADYTIDGVLGALLTLAERHRCPTETLEQAFARVVQETDAGQRLYSAFRRAERV